MAVAWLLLPLPFAAAGSPSTDMPRDEAVRRRDRATARRYASCPMTSETLISSLSRCCEHSYESEWAH